MQPIKNFEENYAITMAGTVITLKTGKYRKPSLNKTGYYMIDLWVNNKAYPRYIHRLVAETYIPNLENKPEVNHIDGNKTHNLVTNLEWVTRSENALHAYELGLAWQDKKLSENTLIGILRELLDGKTITELAIKYNVGLSRLSINLRETAKKLNLFKQYAMVLHAQKSARNAKVNLVKRQQVDQFTPEGIFVKRHVSLNEAARYVGSKSSGSISNALNPTMSQKMAYGYIWRYVN